MDAHPGEPHFWASRAAALELAGMAAFPVSCCLIASERGHSVAHKGDGSAPHP